MYKISPNIDKPCIRQCCLDEHDVCMGCYRSLDDMRIWHSSTDKEKIHMLHLAKERKVAYIKKSMT